MKTKYYLLTIFLISTIHLFSQWEVYIGNPGVTEIAQYVLETYDKGYLFISSEGGKTIWVTKLSINGDILWEKKYNHENDILYIAKVIETSDHGYALVGYSRFFYPERGDPIIIKFNQCFEKEWCKIFHKSYAEHSGMARSIIENENNLLIMLTMGNDDNPDDWINLYGITLEGDVLWEKGYAKKEDYPLLDGSLAASDLMEYNSQYYISGDCYYPYPGDSTVVYLRPYVIGVDENFEEKWFLPYGINDSIHGVVWGMENRFDTIYAHGYKFLHENGEVFIEGLLIKVDPDGNELGYFILKNDSVFPTNINGNIINIKFLEGGKILSTDRMSEDPDLEIITPGEVIFDTLGNVYNYKTHEHLSSMKNLEVTFDNKYLQACSYRYPDFTRDALLYKYNKNLEYDTLYSAPLEYDYLCPFTIESEDVQLDDCVIVSVEDLPTPKEYYAYIATIPIRIYPNPASNIVHFALENTEHHKNITFQVFDLNGRPVIRQNIRKGQKETTANVCHWQSGMYAVVVFSDGKVVGMEKFVVR